jgi:dolichol-phosphate mannosyltransferase
MSKEIRYSVVVPIYNEEAVVRKCYERLIAVMEKTDGPFEIVFINDGSVDASPSIVKELHDRDPRIKLINFSRNFGHQAAISAGMDFAAGDAVVVIDADLQDPPEVILEMIAKWKEGYEVVYGKRLERQGETFFKKATAFLFYRFLQNMTSVSMPADVGDFRLIDRKVCDIMARKIHERNRFIRGIISWVGFKQTSVGYVREKRFAGTTKYPLAKMLRFATDAIIGFSYKPLKLATYLGLFTSACGFLYFFYALFRFIMDQTIRGWTSLVVLMLIFNGMTLFILGIIGEYIGRIYDESKDRPLYIVKEVFGMVGRERVPKDKSDSSIE